MAVVAGVLGGGGWGAASLFRLQVAAVQAPDTPFRPGLLVGIDEDGSPREIRPRGRDVLLYVSAHCRYCRAELDAWALLLGAHPEASPPLLVLAPDTDPGDLPERLMPFASRWLEDPSGAVGRALGVRSVPFFAVLDSAGVVLEVGVGVNTPERRARLAGISR